MATVKVIPPRAERPKILRVAAYCRVSSDSSDQLHSYATQIKAYTELIRQHDDWKLADIYADEGLTGTRMDKREDFQRMMADCRKGRIDRILVKSISRFARNTRDCLSALRELSSLGVTVLFEEDQVDTKTLTSELMVSVFGSLAQQESVSISQNQRISYQRRMEKGEFITCSRPFGYRLVDGKRLEIVESEAKWVRWIFQQYLSGKGSDQIAAQLEAKGVLNKSGTAVWKPLSVRYILSNEKYVGDTLAQKTYTDEFPFKSRKNHGEQDQYYTSNTHPAIISRETFENARRLRIQKGSSVKPAQTGYPLSRKIICGNCGTTFMRKQRKDGIIVWCCRRHQNDAAACPVGRIMETEIYMAFLRMYRKLLKFEHIIITPAIEQLTALEKSQRRGNPRLELLDQKMDADVRQDHKISQLLSSGIIDVEICAAKRAAIHADLECLRTERKRLLQNDEIEETMDMLRSLRQILRENSTPPARFSEPLFQELVEKIVVVSETRLRFHLTGGLALEEPLKGAGK